MAFGGQLFVVLVVAVVGLGVASARDVPLPQEGILDGELDWMIPAEVDAMAQTAGCSISINLRGALPDPQPLILVPGAEEFFLPQTRNGIVRVEPHESIELFCSDAGFAAPFNGANTLLAQCHFNDHFLVEGKSFPFNQLRCLEPVRHTARHSRQPNRNLCQANITHIEVGFEVNDRFIWTMDICHDEFLESTHFSYGPLGPNNLSFQRSIVRPLFSSGKFYGGRAVDHLFTGVRQRITIGNTIGDSRVEALWDNSRDFFLARGHLAARSDYIWEPQQRATFYLMNAAPQWHSFNAGNWERIETGVQQFLSFRNIDASIYTGTFGIQELDDEQGVPQKLFLSFSATGRGRIPVPKFYYKVVIGQRTNRGIAFVGVNNPHATWEEVRSGKYSLCKDISDQVTYVNWKRDDLTMGYSYACDVNDLAAAVKHLPASVRTVGLLL